MEERYIFYYEMPTIFNVNLHILRFFANTCFEVITMAKDSQLDPKQVRKEKAKGGPTMAESALDGEGRNNKKQSGNRHKPGADKS